jgi:predicted transcriptional regulator
MISKLPRLIRGFDSRQSQRLPDLGERELSVLEVLWASGEATAQSVQNLMPGHRISLSTVQSTLERLYRKRLVGRAKQGRAYRYHAMLSRSQLISGLLRNMAQQIAAGDLVPMISGFLNFVSAEAPELAGELSRSLGVEAADVNLSEPDDG